MFSFSADKWSAAGDQTFVSTSAFLIKLQIYFQHTFQLSNIGSPSKLLTLKKLFWDFKFHIFSPQLQQHRHCTNWVFNCQFSFSSLSLPLQPTKIVLLPNIFLIFPLLCQSSSNWVFHCRPHLVCSPELLVPSPLSRPNLHFPLLHKSHNQVCTQTFWQKKKWKYQFSQSVMRLPKLSSTLRLHFSASICNSGVQLCKPKVWTQLY